MFTLDLHNANLSIYVAEGFIPYTLVKWLSSQRHSFLKQSLGLFFLLKYFVGSCLFLHCCWTLDILERLLGFDNGGRGRL